MFFLYLLLRVAAPTALTWASLKWGYPLLVRNGWDSLYPVAVGVASLVLCAVAGVLQNFSREEAKEARDEARGLSKERRNVHSLRAIKAKRKAESMMAYVAVASVLAGVAVSNVSALPNSIHFLLATFSLFAAIIAVSDSVDGRRATARALGGLAALRQLELEHKQAKRWLSQSAELAAPSESAVYAEGELPKRN